MSASVIDVAEIGTTSSSISTFNLPSQNIAVGDAICLFIRQDTAGQTITSITDTIGNTYVLKGTFTESNTRVYVYYTDNIATANSANVIQVVWSSGVQYSDHVAYQVRGLMPGSNISFGDVTDLIVSSSSPTPKIATFTDNSLVIAFTTIDALSSTITFPAGQFTTNAYGLTPSGGDFCNSTWGTFSSIQQNPALSVAQSVTGATTGICVLVQLKVAPASGWYVRQRVSNFTYPSSSSGETATFPGACLSGSVIAVMQTNNNGTVPTISDNASPSSQTYTQVYGKLNAGYGALFAYYVINTSATALAVSWASVACQYPAYQIVEFAYVAGGTVTLDNSNHNTSSGTAMSVSVNVTNSGELAVGYEIVTNSGSFTFNEGFYSVDPNNPGPNGDASMCFSKSVSPSSVTIENTMTPTGSWGMIGATFTTGGSPPPSNIPALALLGVGNL